MILICLEDEQLHCTTVPLHVHHFGSFAQLEINTQIYNHFLLFVDFVSCLSSYQVSSSYQILLISQAIQSFPIRVQQGYQAQAASSIGFELVEGHLRVCFLIPCSAPVFSVGLLGSTPAMQQVQNQVAPCRAFRPGMGVRVQQMPALPTSSEPLHSPPPCNTLLHLFDIQCNSYLPQWPSDRMELPVASHRPSCQSSLLTWYRKALYGAFTTPSTDWV